MVTFFLLENQEQDSKNKEVFQQFQAGIEVVREMIPEVELLEDGNFTLMVPFLISMHDSFYTAPWTPEENQQLFASSRKRKLPVSPRDGFRPGPAAAIKT